MKIALAQTRPVKGDIAANLDDHIRYIKQAAGRGAELVLFPELSVSGYEPSLAQDLAFEADDHRLDILQELVDELNIHVCAGAPLRSNESVYIGMFILSPKAQREWYTKQYLHDDELPFFKAGAKANLRFETNNNLSLSICYELSVPAHAEQAYRSGSKIYLSSVAKTPAGTEKAIAVLSELPSKFGMSVAMVNCVGTCDNFICGGKSTAWNNQGQVTGQLGEREEGLLITEV